MRDTGSSSAGERTIEPEVPLTMTAARASFWSRTFRFKALYNWVTPVCGLLLIRPDGGWMWFYTALALIFCFGLGYWRVSQDLHANREVVRMAVPAQLAAGILFILYNCREPLGFPSGPLLASGCLDVTFGFLFLRFLGETAKHDSLPET